MHRYSIRTLAMTWRLRQHEYRVMEKWECEFAREKRENREMRNFLQNYPMLNPPLDPREAFFDGRYGKYRNPIQRVWRKYVMWTCGFCDIFCRGYHSVHNTSSTRSLSPCIPVPCTRQIVVRAVVTAKHSRRPNAFTISPPIVNS